MEMSLPDTYQIGEDWADDRLDRVISQWKPK